MAIRTRPETRDIHSRTARNFRNNRKARAMEIASTRSPKAETKQAVNPKARTSGANNDSKDDDESALESRPQRPQAGVGQLVDKIA
jgi:hypothetical protein